MWSLLFTSQGWPAFTIASSISSFVVSLLCSAALHVLPDLAQTSLQFAPFSLITQFVSIKGNKNELDWLVIFNDFIITQVLSYFSRLLLKSLSSEQASLVHAILLCSLFRLYAPSPWCRLVIPSTFSWIVAFDMQPGVGYFIQFLVWSLCKIQTYFARFRLIRHPLVSVTKRLKTYDPK